MTGFAVSLGFDSGGAGSDLGGAGVVRATAERLEDWTSIERGSEPHHLVQVHSWRYVRLPILFDSELSGSLVPEDLDSILPQAIHFGLGHITQIPNHYPLEVFAFGLVFELESQQPRFAGTFISGAFHFDGVGRQGEEFGHFGS